MAAGPRDDFEEDEALAAFLDDIAHAARTGNERRALLLLGDILSFPKLTGEGAAGKLEAAARDHREVFAALARVASAGVDLDLVVGNHDAELLDASVQSRLRELVPGLRVHPWIYYLPGWVYAEHGQQHHDLNRMPELLDPSFVDRGDPVPAPLGSELAAYLFQLGRARHENPAGVAGATWRFAARAARSVARMQRAKGRTPTDRALEPYAERIGVPAEALAALATSSAAAPADAIWRLARRRGGGRYMVDAAVRTHGTLLRFGAPARFYVFGHTHLAADVSLEDGAEPARYVNAGTWSTLRPPAEGSQTGLGFLEITRRGGAQTAELKSWSR